MSQKAALWVHEMVTTKPQDLQLEATFSSSVGRVANLARTSLQSCWISFRITRPKVHELAFLVESIRGYVRTNTIRSVEASYRRASFSRALRDACLNFVDRWIPTTDGTDLYLPHRPNQNR